MTLDEACGRYWLEVAALQPSAYDTRKGITRLLARLGKGLPLSQLNDDRLADFVAWRRGQQARRRGIPVSNATVNRDTELLRRILRRAGEVWKRAVEMPSWSRHLLPEADERNVSLGSDAVERFFAALRPDYHPLFRAALSSGVRLGNLIGLRPDQIRWQEGYVVFRVKSKRPGGREIRVPIAGEFAAVLQGAAADGQELVFTYRVRRGFRDRHARVRRTKGQRLPFTQNGWRHEFKRAKKAAGLSWLRFHDLRHAYGNAIYAATGNLKATQRALGHADIASTLRYLRSDIDDVRVGMERMALSNPNRRISTADSEGFKPDINSKRKA
jgi:integrase